MVTRRPDTDRPGPDGPPVGAPEVGPWPLVALLTLNAAVLGALELCFLTLTAGNGVPLPISPLVALVSTPWLVRRAGEQAGSGAAAAPLLAWVLVVGVLGLTGPGDDVLLVDDWVSLALVIAGLVPAAFVLGRSMRAERPRPADPPR